MSDHCEPPGPSGHDVIDGELNIEHVASTPDETSSPVVNHNVIDTYQNVVQHNCNTCCEDEDKQTKGATARSLSDAYIEENMENKINVGCVKWFNIKVGYGFITINNAEHSYDLFVHHSAVKTNVEIYRYLVQGEYVQFEWGKTSNKNYKFQAINVSGINAGKLMCETRNESKQNHFSHDRNAYGKDRDKERNRESATLAKGNNRNGNGNGNRNAEPGQWTVVTRGRSSGRMKGRGGGKSRAQETGDGNATGTE